MLVLILDTDDTDSSVSRHVFVETYMIKYGELQMYRWVNFQPLPYMELTTSTEI